MTSEPLGPADIAILSAQTAEAPLQIGAVCLFEAGPLLDPQGRLKVAELLDHAARRLEHRSWFRRTLRELPLGQLPPRWVDDPDFDPANHFQVADLPEPVSTAGLREFASGLLHETFDPRHPPWGMWIVTGIEGDRVAVVVKASHVLADGMTLLDMAVSLLDDSLAASLAPAPADDARTEEHRAPAGSPGTVELVVNAAVDLGRQRLGQVAAAALALTNPRKLWREVATMASGVAATAVPAPRLAISQPVGPRRDMAWFRVPLAPLLVLKRAEGVKLNDLALAIVAGGLRRYLEARGEPVYVRPRTIVPVSLHGSGDALEHNHISLMVAGLPVDEPDPRERLRKVHDEMEHCKRSNQTSLAGSLLGLGGLLPPALLRLAVPAVLRRQPFVNIAVTDVPGTDTPLYLLGARLLEAYPFISVTANLGVIVGILSYDDAIGMCITVDADLVPDLDELAAAMEASAAELAALSRPVRKRARRAVKAAG